MNTELESAIDDNDLDLVRRLLEADPRRLEETNSYGSTPLMYAVSSMDRSVEMVRLLIKAGTDVNARTREGYTALHYAVDVVNGSGEANLPERVIRLLVEAGARLEERQHWGWTPLMKAVMRGDAEEVRALLGLGANPNVFFPQHSMPVFVRGCSLLSASLVTNLETTRSLLRAGADLQARDEHGQTALEHAQRTLLTSESERFKEEVAEYIRILQEAGATA